MMRNRKPGGAYMNIPEQSGIFPRRQSSARIMRLKLDEFDSTDFPIMWCVTVRGAWPACMDKSLFRSGRNAPPRTSHARSPQPRRKVVWTVGPCQS